MFGLVFLFSNTRGELLVRLLLTFLEENKWRDIQCLF